MYSLSGMRISLGLLGEQSVVMAESCGEVLQHAPADEQYPDRVHPYGPNNKPVRSESARETDMDAESAVLRHSNHRKGTPFVLLRHYYGASPVCLS